MLNGSATGGRVLRADYTSVRVFLLRLWTPQDDDFSNALYGGRVGFRANLVAHGFAIVPIAIKNFHLDELVRGQRAIDFGDHRGGEPAVADLHSRFERMSSGFQMRALARRQ